ncbi:CBS domain-containing protein [Ornithinimicrobium kibberense]|jgi:signal-transduction protein with cAMP-binding, CBS, and nucleotidyltransferase domain|uniref:CBS domain-containing protein n=2 Tax=Ornithinimicrobium kibberense TaxID=282060 RepID=A0ABV5V3E6_9MICO|nr:CBS domain-containing protein [Ornithinimicrobium kibberense]
MLTVADIMITDVYRVSPFATLRDALLLMGERGVKSLVVDRRSEHDSFGLLAYSHILRTIVAEEGDIDLINVYDVALTPVITVAPELSVRNAAAMMDRYRLNRLIVTRQNSLVGLVTMNDIVARIIASLDEGQSPLAPV